MKPLISDDLSTVPVFLYKCIGSIVELGKRNSKSNLQKFMDFLNFAVNCYFIYFSFSIGDCIYYENKIQNYVDALSTGRSVVIGIL